MTQSFVHTPKSLRAVAERLLSLAHEHGATAASVTVAESDGLSVEVYQGRVRHQMHHASQSLHLTAFQGQRSGSASAANFHEAGLREMVSAACAIAQRTGEDPCAGLAEAALWAQPGRELDLYHPGALTLNQAIEQAHALEAGVREAGAEVRSNGAGVHSGSTQVLLATSAGFRGHHAFSQHGHGVSALAERGASRQLDHWSSVACRPEALQPPQAVGLEAGRRALALLEARPVPSGDAPVLFDARTATSLLSHLVSAANGEALYNGVSFLRDGFGKPLFAEHVSVFEDPFAPAALASAPFDADGVAPAARQVVQGGQLLGGFLSTYSARRLGLPSTGHAGRTYNLSLRSERTQPSDTLAALLARMGTGLLVTSLSGQGVRLINGDYSRSARGFWVEGGEIRHPVDQITIAGDLRAMWSGIQAVGAEVHTEGALSSGPVLLERMRIAGL